MLIYLLKAISDLELFITKADINLQLCKALISTVVEIDLNLETAL